MSFVGPVSSTVAETTPKLALAGSNRKRNEALTRRAATISSQLKRWFGSALAIVDGDRGEMLALSADHPYGAWDVLAPLCRPVVRRGRVEFLDDHDPLLVLALPLGEQLETELVAVGIFLQRRPETPDEIERLAEQLGLPAQAARQWAERQDPVDPRMLVNLADAVAGQFQAQSRAAQLQMEVDRLSAQIASTFEEISLIYRLTQNLRVSSNPEELGQMALNWLADVVPAESLALYLQFEVDEASAVAGLATRSVLLTSGANLLDKTAFDQLVAHLQLDRPMRPQIINRGHTATANWPFPQLRELVLVPMAEGERLFGWLVACNHSRRQEFGTAEASLLSSVATILGIHSANIDHCKQQADLLAGVVRVMSSAIDAKDPYTHGHSDRVARVSVRLAQEMGCDKETLKTIYLGGLLHDIGKIGINDNVLRKPGKLTEAEYEHIKTHAEIGYRILRDLRKLGHVLPIVLHHHEAWDGRGYPYGMSGTNIPFLARIVAVADAYDAMASDRPYRKGMSDEKLDAILQDGAGKQWDPEVVAAFFRVRDDIREIFHRESHQLDLNALQWS